MKAITLHQPYASLVAAGHKSIETRAWATRHRGPIAIHAGKAFDAAVLRRVYERNDAQLALATIAGAPPPYSSPRQFDLPSGMVVATAVLADVVEVGPPPSVLARASRLDVFFGDLAPGRFAWFLEDVEAIDPVPARGRQGLWEWAR